MHDNISLMCKLVKCFFTDWRKGRALQQTNQDKNKGTSLHFMQTTLAKTPLKDTEIHSQQVKYWVRKCVEKRTHSVSFPQNTTHHRVESQSAGTAGTDLPPQR